MCRFQVKQHWFQVKLDELYRSEYFFSSLALLVPDNVKIHKNPHKLLKTWDWFAHVSIPSTPALVPGQVWWALSIPQISCSSSLLLHSQKPPKTIENRHKLLKTWDWFAHVSIPSSSALVPGQVWWALSIPLISCLPSFPPSPPKPPKTTKNHHKLQKTSDWFAHVSIPSSPALVPGQAWRALSIPLINSSSSSLLPSQSREKT